MTKHGPVVEQITERRVARAQVIHPDRGVDQDHRDAGCRRGIAVSAGGLISLLPVHVKDVVVAALFLGGAGYLLFVPERKAEEEGEHEAKPEHAATRLREILTAFGVIFVGEFGDLTQVVIANLSAKTRDPLSVFWGAALAFVVISGIGIAAGRTITRVVRAWDTWKPLSGSGPS